MTPIYPRNFRKNYHFKTKDALLDAVMNRHGVRVLSHVLERGQALLAADTPPTPRQVIECVAIPYFELLAREPREGAEWLRIVGQLARAQDERVIRGAQEATRIVQALVGRCFPSTPEGQRVLATAVAVSSLVSLVGQVHAFAEQAAAGVPPHVQRLVVDFVSGGLERAAGRPQG